MKNRRRAGNAALRSLAGVMRRLLVAGLLVLVAVIATAASSSDVVHHHHGPALGRAGGAVPRGTTVFDAQVPGVANLDTGLLAALRRAATDAEREGVQFQVDSGWRSPAYQARL